MTTEHTTAEHLIDAAVDTYFMHYDNDDFPLDTDTDNLLDRAETVESFCDFELFYKKLDELGLDETRFDMISCAALALNDMRLHNLANARDVSNDDAALIERLYNELIAAN